MSKSLRLIAALLGLLAVPALAQTTSPTAPAAPRVPPPAAAVPPRATPATPVPSAVPPRAATMAPGTPTPANPAPSTPAPAASTSAAPAASGKRVDLNSASQPQLDSLPGIGPVRAKAIIAGRPYTDLNDLVTKKILTAGVFDGIKDRVALANINTATAAEMEKTLKGIGDVRSKAIVAGRPYATPQDLVTKGVLTQGVFNGMKDTITY